MIEPWVILGLATLSGAVGLALILPRGTARGRSAGAAFALAALGAWAALVPGLGERLADSLFAVLAAVTVLAAGAMIACRSPIYSAIWFGMTLVGTAGLFLLIGAQFLAVATLVVYAGAILVTFLFVLMLSQPEGHTSYDRRSWGAPLSAATGAVLIGILSMTLVAVLRQGGAPSASPVPLGDRQGVRGLQSSPLPEGEGTNSLRLPTDRAAPNGYSARPLNSTSYSLAQLGTELFTRYVIAVEVAATLLLAALVGAAVIIGPGRTNPQP
jgi:NADH-quinone oxidoreductase subunit J